MIKFNLSVLLAERGITAKKMASDIGISQVSLSNISNNKTNGIQLDTLNKICNYLKVKPNDLFLYVPFDVEYSTDENYIDFKIIDKNKILNFSLTIDTEIKDYYTYDDDGNKDGHFLEKIYIYVYNWIIDEDGNEGNKNLIEEIKKYFSILPTSLKNIIENDVYNDVYMYFQDKVSYEYDNDKFYNDDSKDYDIDIIDTFDIDGLK